MSAVLFTLIWSEDEVRKGIMFEKSQCESILRKVQFSYAPKYEWDCKDRSPLTQAVFCIFTVSFSRSLLEQCCLFRPIWSQKSHFQTRLKASKFMENSWPWQGHSASAEEFQGTTAGAPSTTVDFLEERIHFLLFLTFFTFIFFVFFKLCRETLGKHVKNHAVYH